MTAFAETRDSRELAKFAALADEWWNASGPFRPLHRLNPTRLRFIRDATCNYFGRNPKAPPALTGLSVLDIGCGGGLLTEPLARLGASVTGLDAVDRNIQAAALHAREVGLQIDYQCRTAEDLADGGEQFDLVLNMEVIEHVANRPAFLQATAALVRPGGLCIASTLNRTAKAFLLAIVGAEYLLRWIPRGTHDWRRFVRPDELDRSLRGCGLRPVRMTGVRYNPFADDWELDPADLDVNYVGCWEKPRTRSAAEGT